MLGPSTTRTWVVKKGGVSFSAHKDSQFDHFWPLVIAGSWEPDTFHALASFVPRGGLHIDIGAWIGPTVLFAANIAGRVIAVEPDVVARSMLLKNLELNPEVGAKVAVFDVAISDKDEEIDLYAPRLGDSGTSIVPSRGPKAATASAMGVGPFLDRVIRDEKHCFIKIDVEGAEYKIVPVLCDELRARGISADLLVSLHGDFNIDANRSIEKWARNLMLHGVLIDSLVGYGTLYAWDGRSWTRVSRNAGTMPHFREIQELGGVHGAFLVRAGIRR
jgi:FkbM family methyltransferase